MAINPIVAALTAATRRRPAAPLLTWYGTDGGRTELSVRSYANWVDKTANLIRSLDLTDTVIAAQLSRTHPGNWMSLIWPVAAWQAGCSWSLDDPQPGAELVVTGPEQPIGRPGATTIACSLHPLALGLRDLPDGVLDFTAEALPQPDQHAAEPVEPDAAAWLDQHSRFSHSELGSLAASDQRRLVIATTGFATLREAVLEPLLGAGSAVVADLGIPAAQLDRLARAEHATMA